MRFLRVWAGEIPETISAARASANTSLLGKRDLPFEGYGEWPEGKTPKTGIILANSQKLAKAYLAGHLGWVRYYCFLGAVAAITLCRPCLVGTGHASMLGEKTRSCLSRGRI